MKKLNYLLSAVVLLAVLVTVGCGTNEPGPSAEVQVTDMFAKTWTLTSASLDNDPITDMNGLTLTVNSAFTYSTGGTVARPVHPWPSNGTWEFTTPITEVTGSFQVTRDDGLVIDVTLTETTLILRFIFIEGTNLGSGRVEALAGAWSMEFAAQ